MGRTRDYIRRLAYQLNHNKLDDIKSDDSLQIASFAERLQLAEKIGILESMMPIMDKVYTKIRKRVNCKKYRIRETVCYFENDSKSNFKRKSNSEKMQVRDLENGAARFVRKELGDVFFDYYNDRLVSEYHQQNVYKNLRRG